MSAISAPAVRERARDIFFQTLRARHWTEEQRNAIEIAPESILDASKVVESLGDDPLRLYREIRTDLIREREARGRAPRDAFDGIPPPHRRGFPSLSLPADDPRIAQLDEAVTSWAARWQLGADWCVERAFRTLERWSAYPATLERFSWVNSEHSLLISPVSFKIDQWDGIEPLPGYGKRAKDEALQQVKAYLGKLTLEAKSLKVPTAHDRHGGTVYCWAVRSHVLREPVDRIAKSEGVVFRTVDRAVRELLTHLDLPLGRRGRGRPTGSKAAPANDR